MTEPSVPTELTKTVATLWRIPPPGPDNLLSDARFLRLRDTCESLYSKARSKDALGIALSNALQALGLPCHLPAAADFGLPAAVAAAHLDAAFRRNQVSRLYLCPLDLADDLPPLKFGPNSVRKFAIGELEAIVDPGRLKRINGNWAFDAERFSEFSWMTVEETCPLSHEPGMRAIPWLFMPIRRDWGQIEPHRERFPTSVEAALFAVLLAPWEDWAEYPENDWRGFRVPWVYTLSDDIFIRPSPPPSPDTLSWEPDIIHDVEGNVVLKTERPERFDLNNAARVEVSNWLNDATWSDITCALRSPLFETPIAHFLLRAFSAEPLDEFLAHLTTIEAALGLPSDYGREAYPQTAKRKRLGATRSMAARVSALLGEKSDGEDYCRLFNIRSAYLHGRKIADPIPSRERIVARRLARRVVNALVEAAISPPGKSREDYLGALG